MISSNKQQSAFLNVVTFLVRDGSYALFKTFKINLKKKRKVRVPSASPASNCATSAIPFLGPQISA